MMYTYDRWLVMSQMEGPAWPMESEMRTLTDTAIYKGDYGPKKSIGIVPDEYAEVMHESMKLLRNRIVQSGWMEPWVEFVEFKFGQSDNIRGTTIVVKSVVSIESKGLGNIKREASSHFFDTLQMLPESTIEKAAEEIAREVFEKISKMLWDIKSECEATSRSILMADVGTGIVVLPLAT
ncbi:hypothetical protein HYT05_04175 [Candidatus Kaiserbacteria bacterium]|nr:hypothetical protein [Candidatus Kaiserbacteria bacterium]